MTEYYSNLCTLWQELDLYYANDWSCVLDAKRYAARLEKERVFDFLYGLSQQLDEVRGRVLGSDPFPLLREAFAEVCREENRRKVMPQATPSLPTIESTALVSRGYSSSHWGPPRDTNASSGARYGPVDSRWSSHSTRGRSVLLISHSQWR